VNPGKLFRRLGLVAGILMVLAVVGLVGFRLWLGRYLHGEPFRRLISAATAQALRADGEYLPLHWTGNAAYTDGFAARGRAESLIAQLRADQIRAEVEMTGWWRPQWRVSHLEIQRVNATFQRPVTVANEPGAAAAGKRLELGPIGVREANLAWPVSEGVTGQVRRVQGQLLLGGNDWEATGNGGELQVTGWPALLIEQFRLVSRPGAVHVKESQLRLTDGGRVELTGEVPLCGREFDVVIGFAEVPVRNWLPADWRAAMAGVASGSANVRGRSLADVVATGKINVTGGKLEALPVLDRIALFTQTEQFRSVRLEKASAEFDWQEKRLTVRKLLLESPGLLRVEGGCVVENETMDGEFDVGVAASTLQWLPGSRTQVFTVDRDGYLWTKVKVRGPLKNLQEDLSARLVAAAGKEILDTGKGLLEQGTKTFFELLKKSPL
jgi:hypothetical protein